MENFLYHERPDNEVSTLYNVMTVYETSLRVFSQVTGGKVYDNCHMLERSKST